MALSNCKDCGREVSTRARHCVHCGRPWPGRQCCAPFVTALLVGLVALTAVGGVVLVKNKCRKYRECRIERMERESGARQRELIRCVETEPKAADERK